MDLLRVLNDIHDGKVTQVPPGVIAVRGDTQVDVHEQADYITTVRQMLKASWVMESNRRRAGGAILRLTTIGEVRRDELMRAEVPA